MNILHIASHLGDGAGKAIGGLAVLGSASNEHHILLLDDPQKTNHVERCRKAGVLVLGRESANKALLWADIVVLSWWGSRVMDDFLSRIPDIACRYMLWIHKNGYFDPPLPQKLVDSCCYLLVTTPFTLENPMWSKNSALVYGFGDFFPANEPHKTDYSIKNGVFTIGYVGSPSYKKLPHDFIKYCAETLHQIPNCRFVLVGETSDELRRNIEYNGLSGHISLLGWVDNIKELLLSFDAFGYPLRYDTFATTENAILEAMAAALPIVMSKKPLGRYILDDGVSGLLAETPAEYARIMRSLYENEKLRKQLGSVAREQVINRYNAHDNLQRFDKACEIVVAREKRVIQKI